MLPMSLIVAIRCDKVLIVAIRCDKLLILGRRCDKVLIVGIRCDKVLIVAIISSYQTRKLLIVHIDICLPHVLPYPWVCGADLVECMWYMVTMRSFHFVVGSKL